jgi:hypothetical protein
MNRELNILFQLTLQLLQLLVELRTVIVESLPVTSAAAPRRLSQSAEHSLDRY